MFTFPGHSPPPPVFSFYFLQKIFLKIFHYRLDYLHRCKATTRALEVLRTSPPLASSVGTPLLRKGVRQCNGVDSATVPTQN